MSECPYCVNSFEMNDTCHDEFRMWQGLVGPYYTPSVDENGNLSWTNTGGLPNPNSVNIKGEPGTGLEISGLVDTVGDLPETAEENAVYLVGTVAPYYGYIYANGEWTNIGEVGKGEPGEPGTPGIGVPSGGTSGQVLAKASGTDYDTEWVDQSAGVDPATATPLMDGTAVVGTSTKYAREDHVHPTDSKIELYSKEFNNGKYADYYGQYLVTDINGSYPFTQGMCIGNGNLFQMHVIDETAAVCYKVGLGSGSLSKNSVSTVIHYNDLTYYRDTDVIFGVYASDLVVINPSTFSIVKEVTLSVNVYQIAYIGTGKIVGANGEKLYFFDVDENYNFTLTRTININETYTQQGMCYYDGRLYICNYITPSPYYPVPPDYDYGINISVYDLSGKKLNSIKLENVYGECEGIDVRNGELIISTQRRYDELNCVQSFLRLPLYTTSNTYTALMFNDEGYLPGKQSITVYVDSQYTGFFVDGSEDKPFVGTQEAINHCEHLTNKEITLVISNNTGFISFPLSEKIYRITGATIKRITSLVNQLFLTNCTIGNSSLTNSTLWLRYGETHLNGCSITASSGYYCVDLAYGKLILETAANSFTNGTNAIRAVVSEINNAVQNTFSNITTKYSLSNSRVVDSYLPSYSASGNTVIDAVEAVSGTLSQYVTSNSDYQHTYKRANLVCLNYLLTVDTEIPTGAVTLITGLPAPKKALQFLAPSSGYSLRLRINTSGNIEAWYNSASISAGTTVYVNISYFT